MTRIVLPPLPLGFGAGMLSYCMRHAADASSDRRTARCRARIAEAGPRVPRAIARLRTVGAHFDG